MVHGTQITIGTGVYQPAYQVWGPHVAPFLQDLLVFFQPHTLVSPGYRLVKPLNYFTISPKNIPSPKRQTTMIEVDLATIKISDKSHELPIFVCEITLLHLGIPS